MIYTGFFWYYEEPVPIVTGHPAHWCPDFPHPPGQNSLGKEYFKWKKLNITTGESRLGFSRCSQYYREGKIIVLLIFQGII
jgi:hypothetical protein